MSLGTLSIDLEARLAKLQQGLDKAARLAEKDADRMSRAFAQVKAVAGGIGGALVAGLSVGAFGGFIQRTNDALLAIKDLSEGTGASIENISGLENAVRAGGGTLADVTPVLVKFNGVLKEADGKNGVSLALKAIGLDAAELRKLDPAEALLQVARSLQTYADDGNKARLVQELFGKSVAEVAPLLNDLADNGLKASEGIRAQAEEADKFDKSLNQLNLSVNEVGRSLAGPLVSGLNKVLDLIKTINASGGLFGFEARLGGNAQAGRDLQTTVRQMEILQGIINRDGSTPGLEKRLNELRANAARLTAEVNNSSQALKDFAGTAQGQGRRPANEGGGGLRTLRSVGDIAGLGGGGGGGGGRAGRAARGAADLFPEATGPGPFASFEIPDALTAGLRALEDTDVERIKALQNTISDLLTLRQINGDSPALVEALKRTEEQLTALDPAAQLAKEQTERLLEILAQTPGGALKSVLQDIDLINEAFRTGKIDVEQWAQAVTQASAPLRKAGEDTKQTDTFAKDLGLSFSSAAEDAIVFGKSASEVLKALEQDIIRIITRKLITEPLANGVSGFIGGLGGGGGLSGIFGQLASLLPSFDVGTDYVPRDMVAKIHKGERILTADENRRGMGGGSITNTFNFSIAGPVTRETQAQIAAKTARAVERASRRNN